ncbi:HypC/HybG/HupF family hydrogenase formation chaperone [Verrucomicrobiota bacterium]
MCLAVPVQIVEIDGDIAVVDIGGVRRRSNVSFITDAKVGDFVLLHAGFAIHKWTDDDVREYNRIMGETESDDD